MQGIIETRDRLRAEVTDLDGGYTTIAKILKINKVSVFNALQPDNTPRLVTLERINTALKQAQIAQKVRLAQLEG